jgi:hypothetical protein
MQQIPRGLLFGFLFSASLFAQELDLEKANVPKEQVQVVEKPGSSQMWAGLAILLLVAGIAAASVVGRKIGDGRPARVQLRSAPFAAKLGLTFLFFIYGATHVLAALTVYLDTRELYGSAAEYFRFLSLARLSGLSHAHLMGISTMDALVGVVYLLSRRSSGFACAVVTMTFLGIVGDIASWWLTKYAGSGFELLSMTTGIFFSFGFIIMSASALWDAWLGKETSQ